jgi:hypothetical protein
MPKKQPSLDPTTASNGEIRADDVATETSKSPTSSLLSAARRVRDYKQEGRGFNRQLDVQLVRTPPSEVYFRTWPDPDAEWPVALLKVKTPDDRKEIYVLSPEVAELPHVAPKVRNGLLVPCVTTTGRVFIWARTIPDPNDRLGFRIFAALERACKEARTQWIQLDWSTGNLAIVTPRLPIEEEARWPEGQGLEELYEIAIKGVYIDNSEHSVIRQLNVIAREI